MSKLHLSIISLGFCLILGFGSLAAQKGKKKEPKTTFDVTVVAGDDTNEVWWVTEPAGCKGLANGSNLEAGSFRDKCLPIPEVSPELYPLQISASITRKKTRVQIFFYDKVTGVGYSTGTLSAESVEPDTNSYTNFDIVLNAINVPITQAHESNPVTMINLGRVRYIAQPTP